MKKIDELTKKNLRDFIDKNVREICSKNFDSVFDEFKKCEPQNDTPLGATFRVLEKNCLFLLNQYFDGLIAQINYEIYNFKLNVKNNEFVKIIEQFWEFYVENYNIEKIIEECIADICEEKMKELKKYED